MLSPTWSVVLTVVFVVTGVYSFGRWSGGVARGSVGRNASRPAASAVGQASELNHLVMSVAMLFMVWRPSPTGGTAVQIAIFAVFAVVFLVVGLRVRGLAGRVGAAAYVGMNAAMIWMLAAVPLMGTGMAAAGGNHAGHGQTSTAPMETMAMSTPDWVSGLNAAAVVLMASVAVWWLTRSIRSEGSRIHHCCHALMGAGMGLMLAVMH